MSKVVDNRVVEMMFDNSKFEKNVKQSMGTLDQLNSKLKQTESTKALEGLKYASKNVDLSGITDALTSITDRFSTMGIVGMTVIQELTSAGLNLAKTLVGNVFNKIYTGGLNRAQNIEKAKFQLEGLKIAYDDVADAIDYAVTNTAYSLDAAAQAASMLAASGLDYKEIVAVHKSDGKELTKMAMALRAVSGVAAQTQTDYSMVARYFQDVANAGKVTGATLTYMTQVLNLPVKQDLAEGLKAIADGSYEASESVQKSVKNIGNVTNLTAEDIAEFCKDGLIDFDTFSTIMFNKYADHAVDANKTLEGVRANIRSAWSKIGADFLEPIIRNEGELVGVLDSVRAKINEVRKVIKPVSEMYAGLVNNTLAKLKPLIDGIDVKKFSLSEDTFNVIKYLSENAFDTIKEIVKYIKLGFDYMRAFDFSPFNGAADAFRKMAFHLGEFLEKLKPSREEGAKIMHVIEGFVAIFDILKKTIFAVIKPFGILFDYIGKGASNIFDLASDWGLWLKNLDKSLTEGKKFEKISEAIGNQLKGLIDFITDIKEIIYESDKGFDKFSNTLRGIVFGVGKQLISLIGKIMGWDVAETIEKWDSATTKAYHHINSFADAIKNFINDVRSGKGVIGEFVKTIKDLFLGFNIDTSKITDEFEKFKEAVKPGEKAAAIVKTTFEIISGVVKSLWAIAKPLLGSIADIFKGFFKGIKDVATREDGKKALRNSFAVVFLYEIRRLVFTLRPLIPKLKSFLDFFKKKQLTATFESLKESLNDLIGAFKNNAYSTYLTQLAASILILAVALKMIASIDTEKLGGAFAALSLMILEMSKFAKGLPGTNIKGTGLGELLKLAASLYIIALALKKVASVEPERLVGATLAISGLLLELVGIAKILSNSGTSQAKMTSGLGSLLALAISVRILVGAIKSLSKINNQEALLQSFVVIIGLVAELVGAVMLLSNSSIDGKKMISGISGVIALAIAVKILASAAKSFAEMDWEQLGKAGAAISVALGLILAFEKLATSVTKSKALKTSFTESSTQSLISLGIGLIAFGLAMKTFASAAKSFAEMDWESLGKAAAGMGVILTLVTLFEKLNQSTAKGFNRHNKDGILTSWDQSRTQSLLALGAGLVVIAASMKIFASAAKAFGSLDWEQLGKAGAAITVLLGEITLFSKIASAKDIIALSGAMLIFAVALTALVPAIVAMSALSIGGILASLGEIAGIITVLAVAAKLTSNLQGGMLKLSGVLLIFGAALTAIGFGLTTLSAGVAAAALTLPQIILMIKEVIVAVFETLNDSATLIAETVLNIIDEVLKSLKEHLPDIIDSISEVIILTIRGIRKFIPEFLNELSLLISDILNPFKANLATVDWSELSLIAISITAFIISIAAAAKIAQQNMLGVAAIGIIIAEIVLAFMTLMGLNPDAVLPISEGLAIALLSISAMMFIISNIPVAAAAQGIAGFAVVVAGLTALLAILGGLNQIPGFSWLIGEGGQVLSQIGFIIGDFVGSIIGGLGAGLTSGLPEIADNLSEFMTRLNPFIEGAKKVDESMLKGVQRIAEIILLLTAADLLSGLTSWLTGNKTSLSDFGKQLAEFGPYMRQYGDSIKGIDAELINASAAAASSMAVLAKNLPNSGGLVSFFTGDNDIDDFGKKMVAFGTSLKSYALSVKGIDTEAVEASAAAGTVVADLAKNLPNSGGVAGWFMGDNDMDSFGEQLTSFGKHLRIYANSVRGITPESVEASAAAGKIMATLASELPTTGGFFSLFTGDNSISGFGESLVEFGTAFAEYCAVITGVDFSNSNEVANAANMMIDIANRLTNVDSSLLSVFGYNVSAFAENISQIGGDCLDGFVVAFTDSGVIITDAINVMFVAIFEAMSSHDEQFRTKGKDHAKAYADGMNVNIYMVKQAINKIISTIVLILGNNITYNKFFNYGKMVPSGFADGMEADLGRVQNAANKMVEAAMLAVKAAAQIKSPSRVARGLGRFVPQGFALGIEDDIYYVEAAVNTMVDRSADMLTEAISNIMDVVNSDMDLDPTITPVIDLTNVESGVRRIDSLFTKSVAYGAKTVSTISQYSKQREAEMKAQQNLQNAQQTPTNFNFTQNNYSPKSLSRMDIYRDTKNMFAQAKGALGS